MDYAPLNREIGQLPEPSAEKLEISLLHHMARSGGTLICRCLSAMAGVYLLSEIHPLTTSIDPRYRKATNHLNPLAQADIWYGLLTEADLENLETGGPITFPDGIGLLARRVVEKGGHLVLRDWSHLDFTGVPFLKLPPSYQLTIARVLEPDFTTFRFATVRHALDQWRSLSSLGIMRGALDADEFLLGYRRFAEFAAAMGFIRFEDFVAAPDQHLESICAALHLPFDASYVESWASHERYTGDNSSRTEIGPLPARQVDEALQGRFRANPDYMTAMALLGYEP